jgi:hypothetical protein
MCPRNKHRKLHGEHYGPKQLKQFIQRGSGNACHELQPFEGIPATAGLELWLQNQCILWTFLKETGSFEWTM